MINRRYLRIIYNDKQSSFEQLLRRDNSVSIHHTNIQALAIEIYKIVDGTAPNIIKKLFTLREQSNYYLKHI